MVGWMDMGVWMEMDECGMGMDGLMNMSGWMDMAGYGWVDGWVDR